MANQFRVLPGLLTIRQSGGVIGTDEIQISHDGSNGLLESMSGNITLKRGTKTLTLGSADLSPDSGGSFALGTLTNYFSSLKTLAVTSPQALDFTSANGTGAAGYDLSIYAGDATDGSTHVGGSISLNPGSGFGGSADGKVNVVGSLTATEIETASIQRGGAGTVSLFADAGTNAITVGALASTVVIAGNLQVDGTVTTVNSATLEVTDKAILVNNGGNTAGATLSGIEIEGDTNTIVGYMRSASDNANLEFKAPTGSVLTLDINADTALTMSNSLTVSGASSINQNVTTTGTPTFDTVTINGTTENTIARSLKVGTPTAGSYTGAAGQINATGIFVNGVAVAAGVGALDDLSDVAITTVASGNILYYNGTNFVNAAPGSTSGVQAHDTDLDVIAGLSHTANYVMTDNGTNWTSGLIVNANIDASAAIAFSKMAALTTSRALQTNAATGFIEVSTVTNTELGYVSGVTSAIQTQLNNKQPLDAQLTDIAGLSVADGNFIVGNGANFITETGNTARTSLGVGTGDSPSFVTVTGTTSVVTPTVQTQTINRGAAGSVSLFTDAGTNNINVGGVASTVVIAGDLTVNGATTYVNSTNLDVTDKNITVNKGGTTAGATLSGFNIEGDAAAVVGFVRSAATNSDLELKAPAGSILTLDINANTIVQINSATTGDVLRYDGTKFVNTAFAETFSLSELNDVTISGGAAGDILYTSDGTNYVNATLATVGIQPLDAQLTDIAGLTPTDGNIIVGDGANFVAESGATARTSLGLGTGDSPQFTGVKIGDVSSSSTSGMYVLRNDTTDDTVTELFLDGTSSRLALANDSTWAFEITVVARRTDADDESARYKFDGAIDRNANAASTSLVGDNELSVTEDTTSWNVTVDADTTNGSLRIRVTGGATSDVKWVAFVRTVEVIG